MRETETDVVDWDDGPLTDLAEAAARTVKREWVALLEQKLDEPTTSIHMKLGLERAIALLAAQSAVS